MEAKKNAGDQLVKWVRLNAASDPDLRLVRVSFPRDEAPCACRIAEGG